MKLPSVPDRHQVKQQVQKITTPVGRGGRWLTTLPSQYRQRIRDKAIDRARTRLAMVNSDPASMSPQELEILVKEEEDKIKSSMREKGVLAALALLGINLLG